MNSKLLELEEKASLFNSITQSRRSCRAFRPEPVAQERIEAMLEVAQRSASWCNSQPWQVHIASGEATERLRTALHERAQSNNALNPDLPFPGPYQGVYRDRQREAGWQLYSSVGIAHGDREASARQGMENYRLFGAPHALFLTTPRELGVYGVFDCGIYLGTLLLAAESLGIAMVPQAALASFCPMIREILNIDPGRDIICGASFGFADVEHPANSFRTGRASISDAAHWISK